MQKKLLSLLLAFCMLLGLFPFTMGAAALTADETTGKVHLRSAADVLELMNDASLWGADIVLENDIDLAAYDGTLEQTPIGAGTTAAAAFKGSFDGQGYTISGVNLVTAEKTSSWGFFGCVAGATIQNLTLEGTVSTSGAYVAGLVGIVATSATIRNCTNGCAVTGANDTAGIVGLANSASAALRIENCRNTGAVSGAKYVGGIVARSKNPATLTGCLNVGDVTASAPDASGYIDLGGIGGLLYTAHLSNCMNTGSITVAASAFAKATKAVGGLIGRAAPTAASSITACYNAGTVNASAAYAILGHKQGAGTLTVTGSYYKTGTGSDLEGCPATAVDLSALTSGEDCKMMFDSLPDTAWTYTSTGPELTAFHTHSARLAVRYDNDSHWYICDCYGYRGDGMNVEAHSFGDDNVCMVCGAEKTDCAHGETYIEEITPSTCSRAGTGNTICAECGIVLETDVELPLDPDMHDGKAEAFFADGKVAYRCSACGATVKTESRAPLIDIYVSSNGMTLDVGYISDAIGIESKPFADLADALDYAAASANANAAVTVHIAGTAALPTAYEMPDYTGAVTITGGVMNFTGTTAAEQSFHAGGALTFENIAFTTEKSRVGARIFARNHKLVMGEGITMQNSDPMTINAVYSADGATIDGVKMYIFGGFAAGAAPTAMNTDVTIRSGEYWEIAGWNNGDKGTAGAAKLTIGKTDAEDTLILTYLVPFSDGAASSITADSAADVIVDGDVEIYRVYCNAVGGNSAAKYTTNFVLKGAVNGTHYKYESGSNFPSSYRYGYDLTYSAKVTEAAVNVYTDMRLDSAKANAYPFFGDGADIVADDTTTRSGHTFNSYTYCDYCRDVLGGHSDGDGDGFCDECGASMNCAHTEGYTVVDRVPATCTTQGSEGHKCNTCGIVYETVVLELDPSNHASSDYIWHFDSESGVYYQNCTGCGGRYIEQTALPTVYVDGFVKTDAAGLSAFIGDDANSGATADTAVKTVEEAASRLAATGGRVLLADDYIIADNVTLPTYERTIVFSAVVTAGGAPRAGFVFTAARKRLTLGGPTEFTAVRFDATNRGGVMNDNGGNIPFIVAEWNDVSFTGGVETYGMLMFVGGRYMATTNDDTVKTVDFRFEGITAKAAGSGSTAKTYPSFRYLYLGDAEAQYLNGDKTAAENLTVSNKTVNAVLTDVSSRYIITICSSNAPVSVQTANCSVSLTLDGNSTVEGLYTGWSNTGNATVGTAFIDELTIHLYGNSTVTASMSLYNARKLTLDIAPHDSNYRITAPIKVLMTGVYTSTGEETAVLTYGTHSIAGSTALPAVASGYAATVQMTDECLFGDWVVTTPATPEADGIATRTCTECGRTETKTVAYECAHSYIAASGGTIYCGKCGKTFESLTAPIMLSAQAGNIANGQFDVIVKLDSTTPLTGVDFSIDATEGITLTSVSSLLPEATMDADPSTLTSLSFGGAEELVLPYRMVILDIALGNNTYTATEVVKLTFAVADNVTEGKVTLTVTDAYCDTESLDAAAIGAEVAAATHTHEYTASVTKEATCGEAGVMTYTCVCGDSYTEVIPATGEHQYGEWIETKPAEPGAAGEETRTCTVCGHTETRATDPLPETYAAYIGETGYATVQAAMDAANVLDTVTVVKGTVETVTPSKTVYLAGDYSGVTISGDYTLDVTGRYALVDGEVVTDSTIEYVPLAVKAIVRPTTTGTIAKPNLSTNLGLGSSIEYKFNSKITYVEGFADFYVKLELLGLDGKSVDEGSTDDTARTLIITDHVVQGDAERYTYVFDGIPAKCMNNTIRYTAYAVREDGSVETLVYNWGAYVYLQKQLPTATGELKDLLVALINYGALAQQYRDYNTENLISDLLDEADRRLSTEDFAELEMTKIVNGTPRTNDGDLFKSFASSLQLYDKIKVIASVSAKNTSVTEYNNVSAVYSYPDSISGETITKVVPFEKWSYNATSKKYEINMDDISAKDLRQLISFNIYADYGTDVQTSVYAIENLTFNSAENYCATQRTSSDVNLAALCCGIIHYSDMAKAYLGAK